MSNSFSNTLNSWASKNAETPDTADGKDSSISTTLIHGLNILDCFKQSGNLPSDRVTALSNAEIAARLGMNKATVSRLCKTLILQNFLRKDAEGKFLLAPRTLALSYPILASMDWRQPATDLMEGLAKFSQGNISLAVFSGAETIFVKTTGASNNFPHVPEIGMTTPVPETSTGRALLSMLSDQELDQKMAEVKRVYPKALARHASKIIEAQQSCQTRGFCIALGEWRANIFAASAPVGRTSDGLCVVLTCGVPAYRTSRDELESDLGPRLALMAQTLREMKLFC